jgi:hypothetical protein
VDLDSDSITVPETEALPPLPDRLLRPLLKGLRKSVRDGVVAGGSAALTRARALACAQVAEPARPIPQDAMLQEPEVSELFLQFFARLMSGYQSALLARRPPARLRPPGKAHEPRVVPRVHRGTERVRGGQVPEGQVHEGEPRQRALPAYAHRYRCRLASSLHGVALRVEQFLDTQMFQCFVDDRYGDAAQSQNLEAGRSSALYALPLWLSELGPGL